MTKLKLPYCIPISKYKILNILDIFKLSVAKLMYSFDDG